MELLADYGLFLAKAVTIVLAIGVTAALIAALGQRQRGDHDGRIEVRRVNDRYRDLAEALNDATLDPAERKVLRKSEEKRRKKEDKEKARAAKKQAKAGADARGERRPRLFVLDFDGDIRASAVSELREEVSVLLGELSDSDEVLLRLESAGGLVHSYGLAASQLRRIRDRGCRLTVAVDKVAASGGYMMACVGQEIVAAPFAVIGSIGVLAQLPNFHRLLKKNDIDFELVTAGEYKRTLTLFGENTDKGREKFREEIEDTHQLFKDFVGEMRPVVDIDRVATGEVWYGQRALDVGLIDALETSDAWLLARLDSHDVFEVSYLPHKNWQQKLGLAAESAIERVLLRAWELASVRPKQ
ncbi:MAG: protease SohB [Halieaceae bacterium]|jgi:serine protease SohB|nr:protease SohB [Halieaceae bacterium]